MQTIDAPLLAFENISFTHRGKNLPLFSKLHLALAPGDRIGLLGRNGTGKSTLLHLGAGLLLPDTGAVRLWGKMCRTEKDFVGVRKVLGYLLQHAADQLFCSTVLEDVAFGPYNLGYSAATAESMARNTLKTLGLSHLADRNGQRLSGGEQKLAALATILVMDAQLLFLDEPTNDLDDEARELLVRLLERFNLPCLIASHDLPFLRRFCTKFYVLDGGALREIPVHDIKHY